MRTHPHDHPSRTRIRRLARLSCGVLLTFSLFSCGRGSEQPNVEGPTSTVTGGPRPSQLPVVKTPPPALNATGLDAMKAAVAFVDWASDATLEQREEGRAAIHAASGNDDLAAALTTLAFEEQKTDHSRALVTLSVLGELRNPVGEAGLTKFVLQAFPTGEGTGPEGENLAQTALAELQSKALEGLAYMGTESANAIVLRLAAGHPSRAVRAAAVRAYLYNNPDSQQNIYEFLRPEDYILVDRPNRDIHESATSFNAKLAVYLRQHPELNAQDPDQGGDAVPVQPVKPAPGEPPAR